MATLIRLDLWDDIQANAGRRRAVVKNWLGCDETVDLSGVNTMVLTLHGENEALVTLDTPSGEINADLARVIRAVYADGTFLERRIEDLHRESDEGESRVRVTAHDLRYELGQRGKVFRRRAGGGKTFHFQAANQTARQHLNNYILPALWEAGAPYWAIGTLETDDEPVTVVYDMDAPAAALAKLISAHTGYLELWTDYSPAHGKYLIHLLRQIGGAAAIIRLRGSPALVRSGLTRTLRETGNRVYGFGAGDAEVGRASLAENVWELARPRFEGTSIWYGVSDPAGGPGPIAYDGQYTGHPLGRHRLLSLQASDAQFYIEDSSAARQEFRTSLIQGGFVSFPGYYRIAAPTDDLAYVERLTGPGSGRTFPVQAVHVERPEVSGVINLTYNPTGRIDPAAVVPVPVGWTLVGNPAIARETNPVYIRHGAESVRVTFSTLTQAIVLTGIANGAATNGRLSYYADVMTLAGQVEARAQVQIRVVPNPDGSIPANTVFYPAGYATEHGGEAAPLTYRSTVLNQWERLGIEGVHDCNRRNVLFTHITIHPRTVPSTCIIDAGQVTNTATYRDLVVGGGGSALLQAANARLLEMADYAEEVAVDALDVSLVDDRQFPVRDYVLGGGVQIDLPEFGLIVRTRVTGWERNWLEPERFRLKIAGSGADLLRFMATRFPTQPPPPPESGG